MKLYHAADIHLGRRRLDGRLPDQDFADAFRYIANAAVADSADALILGGDLFDRPQVEPEHLRQAQEILRILSKAGIPVIAIEGNHDKAFVHSEDCTWVRFLAQDRLLTLLSPRFGPEGAILTEYDPVSCTGAYIELGGIRFIGAGYLGAATPAKVRQVADKLDGSRSNVLILHAGPDYFVGEGGGFAKTDLAEVRARVSYLALGHIHKPMVHDGWACNPGSPENCDLREAAYGQARDGSIIHRGYAVVEIDPKTPGKPVRLEIRSTPRRPVSKVELDCTPFGNKLKDGAAAFVKAAVKGIRDLKPEPRAVIDLRMKGTLNLNRIALNHDEVCAEICSEARVFAVALDATQLNCGEAGPGTSGAPEGGMSREDLERQAIRNLAAEDLLCAQDPEAFSTLFFELKEAVRAGSEEQVLAELISTSPLVEQVRATRAAELAAREVTPIMEKAESEVGI